MSSIMTQDSQGECLLNFVNINEDSLGIDSFHVDFIPIVLRRLISFISQFTYDLATQSASISQHNLPLEFISLTLLRGRKPNFAL